jgi:hypothetical protein
LAYAADVGPASLLPHLRRAMRYLIRRRIEGAAVDKNGSKHRD